jgi:drug/metabolite transporter (DMT)-like permease
MSPTFKAALWMTGAIASFSLMAVAGRTVQTELNTFELMFWRSVVGFVIIVLILRARGPLRVATQHKALHLTRNVFHFTGQNLWFYGLTAIPLAQLVALEFTMPIWVVLLAPFVLGEAFRMRRAVVALLGFAGALIVAQPGVQPVTLGHLAAVGSAVGFALNVMLTRRLMRHDPVLVVLFWMTALQALFGLVLALALGFTWPSAAIWPALLVVGITGLTAHFSLTSALGLAPATVVAPMEFARLPIMALIGAWAYAETLDPLVFLGAVVIFSANWWNMRDRGATK